MIQKGTYKHYKGNLYQVVDVAKHSETEEWMVVYHPLYGDESNRHLWVRPLDMFTETVVVGDKEMARFALISED